MRWLAEIAKIAENADKFVRDDFIVWLAGNLLWYE